MTVSAGDWTDNRVFNEVAARVDRAGAHPVSEDHMPGLVLPERDWLITYLAKINTKRQADVVIVQHARNINWHLNSLRLGGKGRYSLTGNTKVGVAVHGPIKSTASSLTKELKRLERAASSGSLMRWLRAWACVSPECRRLVWRPELPPVVRSKNGFTRAKLTGIVGADGGPIGPRPFAALPGIKRSLQKQTAKPANQRQGNKPDEDAAALAIAMRAAVVDLTGRARVTDNRIEGKTTGVFADFGAAFDQRFGTRVKWRVIEKSK
jgi:hypothetical protein